MKEYPEFLHVSNNTMHKVKYTWAQRIFPKSEIKRTKCTGCGKVEEIPAGAFDVKVEGGSEFPDLLGCGAYPFFILSQRGVKVFDANGINSFEKYPVNVAEVESERLSKDDAPQYFRLEISGHCEIDLKKSGAEHVKLCNSCGRIIDMKPMILPSFKMKPRSWDGSNLFRDAKLFPRVIFCTDFVMRVAGQNRLTNFRFEPMGGPFDVKSPGLDYLSV